MIQNYIINSIEQFCKDNIDDLFIYTDSIINISKIYSCNSKIDLPLGTEVTFVVQDTNYSVDLTDTDLKNWYVRFTNIAGIDEYRLITACNTTTGTITIDDGFGQPILTTDKFDILILDSLFITDYNYGGNGGRKQFKREYTRIRMLLQTKEDSKRIKIRNFIDKIKGSFYSEDKVVYVFDETAKYLGNVRVLGEIEINEKINNDNNLQGFVISFLIDYVVKY